MLSWTNIEQLQQNVLGLGARRLTLLALIGAAVLSVVLLGSFMLSRPEYEALYIGLAPQDSARISGVLKDSGIAFDVSSDGTRVMVKRGRAPHARALLAERGLPNSTGAGYELFDKLGPLGLTNFMQEVTRVRALEGEIARTVQSMKGVTAARVHIVLGDPGSFRRSRQPPSASVVIRTENSSDSSSVQAIRHLVAAAVPGLTVDNVRILSTDGAVMAAGGEENMASPGRMVELERTVSKDLLNNVRRTLAPHLGVDNFEASVSVRLNIDKRQTTETKFDPDTKVERSVRVVKEAGNSQNNANRSSVSVEQNIPAEQTGAQPVDGSKKSNQRRDEVTNYEISSRSTATASEGYRIENITIAVALNRTQLAGMLGANATPEVISKQVAEIERLVSAAAGIDTTRGDRVTVAALEFAGSAKAMEPAAAPGIVEILLNQVGTFVMAGAIVVVALMLIWFGLRPATQALLAAPNPLQAPAGATLQAAGGGASATASPGVLTSADEDTAVNRLLADLAAKRESSPLKRLERLIDLDQKQAAAVLRKWVREGQMS